MVQVGPLHSRGNTAVNGRRWPNSWADTASFLTLSILGVFCRKSVRPAASRDWILSDGIPTVISYSRPLGAPPPPPSPRNPTAFFLRSALYHTCKSATMGTAKGGPGPAGGLHVRAVGALHVEVGDRGREEDHGAAAERCQRHAPQLQQREVLVRAEGARVLTTAQDPRGSAEGWQVETHAPRRARRRAGRGRRLRPAPPPPAQDYAPAELSRAARIQPSA